MKFINKLKVYFKRFYSIDDIDKKMLKYLNYKYGYYLECGANDGIRQSNTYHFERFKGWRGVLVEPSYKFNALIKNRSNKNYFSNNVCVSPKNENQMIKLKFLNLMTRIIDKKIINNPVNDLDRDNMAKRFMTNDEKVFSFVSTGKTLTNILDEAKAPKIIDFFSLDVEGSEFEVIDGVDFKKYNFKFFLIETNDFDKLNNFMIEKKYSFLEKLSSHDYLFKYNA